MLLPATAPVPGWGAVVGRGQATGLTSRAGTAAGGTGAGAAAPAWGRGAESFVGFGMALWAGQAGAAGAMVAAAAPVPGRGAAAGEGGTTGLTSRAGTATGGAAAGARGPGGG